MYILGVNCFSHDTSACLLEDGRIIAFAEEERFNRDKHTKGLPFTAVEYCLDTAGINSENVDIVAFPFKPKLDLKRGRRDFKRRPSTYKRFAGQVLFDFNLNKKVRQFKKSFNYDGRMIFTGHHEAHAASSYYASPFKEAAVLSIDRGGDYLSTVLSHAKDNRISTLSQVYNPHSMGSVYSSITKYLGFKPNGGEGKVMGLAPYGSDVYCPEFKKIVDIKSGSFKVNLSYFKYHKEGGYDVSSKFIKIFGEPRKPESPIEERHQNIAYAVQWLTEEVATKLARWLFHNSETPNLCIAGGLGLNGVMNTAIREKTAFEKVFINPASNDGGTSLGAALYVWHNRLEHPKKQYAFEPYLGPEYSNRQIKKALEDRELKFNKVKNPAKSAAKLLAEDKIVGWFQGRMEAGPRALGNRSILANPCRASNKDILNKRVKFRESFRPFAPSVKEEKAGQYFRNYYPSPFMLEVLEINWFKAAKIPAVCHVDGTGRLQTVKPSLNPLYWELLDYFENETGIPLVLNTSFNVRGEPIVCNPADAINCFTSTGMDALVIGNYLVRKGSLESRT